MGLVASLLSAFQDLSDGPARNQPEGGSSNEEEPNPSSTDQNSPSLFQCPSCQSVYVAVEKVECSSCDTAVEQLDTTRSKQKNAA